MLYRDGLQDRFMDAEIAIGSVPLRIEETPIYDALESLDPGLNALDALHVPLTDSQYEDYLQLKADAAALHAEGRRQEAARVSRLAANILRTSAPGLE